MPVRRAHRSVDVALEFPRDHGSHPDAPVEWWYYTGHLSDRAGKPYGFQLTFFRVRDLHLAHFAWTDVLRKKFAYEEKTHLALPGIASAAVGRLDVSNEDWSAVAGPGGVHVVTASGRSGELRLTLTPAKPPVAHGEAGLSRKGPGEREYSRYVSITRLNARGTWKRGVKRGLDGVGGGWNERPLQNAPDTAGGLLVNRRSRRIGAVRSTDGSQARVRIHQRYLHTRPRVPAGTRHSLRPLDLRVKR